MTLRPYQIAAADAVMERFREERACTLLVLATGAGKTQVACEVMSRWLARPDAKGRILFLAHRDELILQADHRIEQMLGFPPNIEKAEKYDERSRPVLVASVQTLARQARLDRHNPDHFSLVIVDEVHHAAADTYLRILDHFANSRKLGLTATATRADGKKLGAEWESVAFEYGIRAALKDGWLAPIRRQLIRVDSLSLDSVAVRAGDFVQAELEARVLEEEETVHSWARGILDAAPGRKTLVFCPGVESSRKLAECLNRYAGDEGKEQIAIHLDGEKEQNDRRMALGKFRRGEIRIVTNCALFLEGYDEPSIECVAMCRPTKSHSLYSQMIGRGTRLHDGKKDLLVLDFTSASQRFDVVTAIDILADGESEEVVELAEKELAADPTLPIEEALARAQKRQEAKEQQAVMEAQRRAEEWSRRQVTAKGTVSLFDVDTVIAVDKMLGINEYAVAHRARRFGAKPISDKQRAMLEKSGFAVDDSSEEGLGLARARLDKIFERMSKNLCSVRQAKVLAKHGFPTGVSFDSAKRVIDALAANRWRLSSQQRDSLLQGLRA